MAPGAGGEGDLVTRQIRLKSKFRLPSELPEEEDAEGVWTEAGVAGPSALRRAVHAINADKKSATTGKHARRGKS